ncbi:hypothetical protein Pmani_014625 [Petrolisthes manimaculis]|uniref:CHK kinase-like domain-containing protein n=1 Tax=Petrolisthes manimaculis TaxID=1843537 RepID=A0AAE1PTX2_9EUCA|nr:hypothetical protein Pmani_014625 [Petrolisthes manimaculis]
MSKPAEEQLATKVVTPQSLVTEEEVKAALRLDKGSDALLKSWSMVDFTKKGDNYACVVSSVQVQYSLNQENMEVVYIAKLNPCRHVKEFDGMTVVLFRKESEFYSNLVPELNSVLTEVGQKSLRFPKCFHGCLDKNKEVILLEDLRPHGYKMFDRRRGLDVAHITLILKELGRLHASSRLLQAKTPDQDLTVTHDFLVPDVMADESFGLRDVFDRQLDQGIELLERFGGYERSIAWVKSLKLELAKLMTKHLGRSKYNVVCHGDCWNNNVLFRYNDDGEPVEVMLLDLQINRFSSPATDLIYLMYTSLNGEVRIPNVNTFLDIYYDTFNTVMEAAGMDMIFTRSELLKEFRSMSVLGAIYAMMVVPFMLLEPEDTPDMDKAENMEELLLEVKQKTMAALDNNPLIKPRFLSVFDEMMNIGIIP